MMKYSKYFLALIIVSTIFTSDISAQQTNQYITAIAFYNLENLFDTENDPIKFDDDFTPTGSYKYTEEIYKKKLENLSKVLSEIATDKLPNGPAIIGVAEIENHQVIKDLVAMPLLKDRGWKTIHIEGPDRRGIDVGFIYNPTYFKVIEAKSHEVILKKTESSKREYTRDILQVTGLLMGDTLDILVGHWPSRRGGEAASQWKRMEAAKICKDIKDNIIQFNPNARIIIMGDLNDDPVSASVVKTLDVAGNIKKVTAGGLYNPFMSFYKKGVGTLGYNDSWNLFDQIIVSSGFILDKQIGWRFKSAHIFNKNYLKNQFGQYKGYPHRSFTGTTWVDGFSDHFPTYIYIVKNK